MSLSSPNICDPDLDFLERHVRLIDVELGRIVENGRGCGDPVTFGIFDDAESLLGLGFVACQRYIAATCGWMRLLKHVALSAGPRHASGMSVAEVINHAGNYWKHQDEWTEKRTPQQERTEAAMREIEALDTEFPMMAVLAAVDCDTKLASVLVPLVEWRDELRAIKA